MSSVLEATSALWSDVSSDLWPDNTYIRCRTVAVSLVGCYVVKLALSKCPWFSQKTKKFAAGKFKTTPGVLVLHQFSRGKTCPNLSPFALKVECFLRLSKIPYEVDCSVPFGPKTKCPWVNLEGSGEPLGDSQFIINTIAQKEKASGSGRLPPGDAKLSSRDRAALEGMRCLVEEQLFWCVIYWRYCLDGCKTFLTTQRFPRFLNFAFPLFMTGGIKKKSTMQGIATHTPEEIFEIARSTCEALDSYIGDCKFFCGDEPGTADCAIFGGLSQIRWNAPGTHYEALVTERYPRLGAYCDRMKTTIYHDWDLITQEGYQGNINTSFARISDELLPKISS